MRRLILAVALFVTSLAFAHDHEEKHIHAKYRITSYNVCYTKLLRE